LVESIPPPERDEIEISAFGPGYGECILVHLGEGEWLIVDSCTATRRSPRVPVLEYLSAMGVDPAKAVKLVVATHWHDDHIRGISDVVDACQTASFACSSALSPPELLAGIGRLPPNRGGKRTSGVKEMRVVLDLLVEGESRREAKWAIQDRSLYSREGAVACEVLALAPRDKVLREAFEEVARLVEEGDRRRVRRPDCNKAAIVLWIEVGDTTLLLGSDLQEVPGGGWTAIIACRQGKARKSDVFKVPHHGSKNGHLGDVWDRLLVDQPEAVVCPNRNGRYDLPTPQDVTRLCELATVHLTAPPSVETVVRKGRPMRAIAGTGRVTLRRPVASPWMPSYGGKAGPVCAGRTGPEPMAEGGRS